MKIFLLALGLISLSVEARDLNLKCEASLNSDRLFEVQVTLPEGQRNTLIAKTDEYQFFVSQGPGSILELQVYNRYEPSRSYATANLDKSRQVELILWKRDSLVEMRCTQIN